MERQIRFHIPTFILIAIGIFLLGVQVQCPGAVEARPLMDELQAQIDELRSLVAQTPVVVDSNDNEVGVLADLEGRVMFDLDGLPVFGLRTPGSLRRSGVCQRTAALLPTRQLSRSAHDGKRAPKLRRADVRQRQ